MTDLAWLEERLGYRFEDSGLLRRALIHRSAKGADGVSPEDVASSLRLSWLGDSVLDMVVSEKLCSMFPAATKKDLHRWSVELTNNKTLGRVASQLGLGRGIVIGRAMKMNLNAKDRHTMLAGALEAIFGAVLLDSDVQSARSVIRRVLKADFDKIA